MYGGTCLSAIRQKFVLVSSSNTYPNASIVDCIQLNYISQTAAGEEGALRLQEAEEEGGMRILEIFHAGGLGYPLREVRPLQLRSMGTVAQGVFQLPFMRPVFLSSWIRISGRSGA